MKFITKRTLSIFIAALAFVTLTLYKILPTGWCKEDFICNSIYRSDYLGTIIYSSIGLIAATFPCLLILLFLRDEAFEAWKKFAVWTVPVVLLLTYFVTSDTGSGGFFAMDFSIYYLAIVYATFFLTSLIIIVISTLRSRNKS